MAGREIGKEERPSKTESSEASKDGRESNFSWPDPALLGAGMEKRPKAGAEREREQGEERNAWH